MFRSIFCMTGLVICFMVGLSLAFSVIMDMNMAKNFKQGIKLNGEIVQVFLSRDKRVAYIGPKVSVILYNQERIFQSVIMYQSYKINDQVEVFYNEKKYPKYV